MVPMDEDGNVLDDVQRDLQDIPLLSSKAITESTRELYGSAVLLFQAYCNIRGVRALPASHSTVLGWISALAGSFASSTIGTYVTALRTWHQIQNVPWGGIDPIINRAVNGTREFEPDHARKRKRAGWSIEIFMALAPFVDGKNPRQMSAFTAACVAFFSLARLGELLVKKGLFDPLMLPARRHLDFREHRRVGESAWVLHIPRTKCNQLEGEDLYWVAQPQEIDFCDPVKAMNAHLALNDPAPDEHIFAYTSKTGRHFLTRAAFTAELKQLALSAKIDIPTGHSFRIGGCTEHLLRGMSFEDVKHLGRWNSDAFDKYLRRHAEILSPRLTANAEAVAQLARIIGTGHSPEASPP